MKLLITGATGLVGAELVKAAAADPAIRELVLLVRKAPPIQDPKIRVVLLPDFLQYDTLADEFRNADAIAWCLGTSQTQVGRKEYEIITVDYTRTCAEACLQYRPDIRFVFVSGDGADPTEKSRTLFRRLKGRAENILLGSGLNHVIIARPDAVRPRGWNPRAPLAYKMAYPFFPLLEWLIPQKVIWCDVLGRALLLLVKKGAPGAIIENRELRVLGQPKDS